MKMLNIYKYKKICLFTLFVLITLSILVYLSPTATGFDENYTLALINHSYSGLIHLDSMDVHPILYYFLLKSFIKITTFWTKSIIIKVLFTRIFSLITSVLLFMYLRGILNEFSIKNNVFVEWILFLILPGMLNITFISSSQIMNIRMYSLAALFISAELYYLIKYQCTDICRFLFLTTMFAIAAAYTHYYATIFSGLLLFVYLLKDYFKDRKKESKNILWAIGALLVSFMPWLIILIKQIENPSTYWLTNSMEIKEILKFIVLISFFFYPLLRYGCKNKSFLYQLINMCIVITSTFLIILLFVIIKGNIFQCKYMFPMLIIYEFLSINIAFKYLINKKFIYTIILILNILCSIKAVYYQIPIYNDSVKSEYVYHVNKKDVKSTSYDSGILTNILLNHKQIIVPKNCEHEFYNNIRISHSHIYRYLFKYEIMRIKVK